MIIEHPEGTKLNILNYSEIQKIPLCDSQILFDDDFKKPIIPVLNIDKYCNDKFKVIEHDFSIGKPSIAPNGEPYRTYALGIYCSRELLEDNNKIGIKIQSFLTRKTLNFFKNQSEKLTLAWRIKPEFDEYTDDSGGKVIYIRMRCLLYEE